MRRAAPTLAAAVLAVGLGGCDLEQHPRSDPPEELESVAQALLDTCAREDGSAALDLLTHPARVRFLKAGSPVEGCREVTAPLAPPELSDRLAVAAFDSAHVASVRRNGDIGSVTLATPVGDRAVLEAFDIGDGWLVGNP